MGKAKTSAKIFKHIPIISILVLAAALRIWGINSGFPYHIHFDEQLTTKTAFFALQNNLKPDHYFHTMAQPTILIAEYIPIYFWGLFSNRWESISGMYLSYLQDPSIFILVGRVFMAAAGSLTAYLVFFIGKPVYGKTVALLAAYLLSVSFLHVQESHYIKEDVLITIFGLLLVNSSIKIAKSGDFKDYFRAGIFLGCIAALKYHAFIFMPTLIIAHLFNLSNTKTIKRHENLKLVKSLAFSVLVFFIINPYILLERNESFQDIFAQTKASTMQWLNTEEKSQLQYYLTEHIPNGLGNLTVPLTLLGTAIMIYRKQYKVLLPTIGIPFFFFLTIKAFGGPGFARYAVILTPYFCLLTAYAVSFLSNLVIKRKIYRVIFSFVLVFVLSLPMLIRSVKYNRYLTGTDTRLLVKDWIEKNIPSGEKIAVEGTTNSFTQPIWGPFIVPDVFSDVDQSNMDDNISVYGLLRLDFAYEALFLKQSAMKDVSWYLENNYCYLIHSSWATHEDARFKGPLSYLKSGYSKDFINSLQNNYSVIKEFNPHFSMQADPIWNVDYEALDKIYLGHDNIVGPSIIIYKSNKGCT